MPKSRDELVEHHSVAFGRNRIPFKLIWRNRKSLGIEVYPDKSVTVLAPAGKDLEEILSRVRKRATWILRQRDYFEKFHPVLPPRRYVGGETHRYLGRQYRLKIVKNQAESVKLKGCFIWVRSTNPDDAARSEKLVNAWYSDHAKAMFHRRLQICIKTANGITRQEPRLIVRRMKKRWGSCSKGGTILLNTELIKAPVDCIDYVIMHELCHLRERKHTPRFFRLLSLYMPDWERRKARLELATL